MQSDEIFDVGLFLTTPGPGRSTLVHQRNQVVYSQGDPADAIFYIQNGNIKLTVLSHEGKEAVVAILGAENLFGEACLGGESVRHATAIAVTNALITRIAKDQMSRALRKHPMFSEFFLSYVLSRNVHLEADLVDQLCNSCEKRLARVLLLLTDIGRNGSAETVTARINQETLAAMVGTTRPRISYLLNKFKKLGFIEYGEGLQVNNSLVKVVLHEEPFCEALGNAATARGLRKNAGVVQF